MAGVSAPPPPTTTVTVPLSRGGSGVKRLLGGRGKGEHRLTMTPGEIVVEHGRLLGPLRFAPGSVAVAAVDPGPATLGKNDVARGRFPVLHRLASNRVVPRDEGVEGWLWTSLESSVFTVLTDEAPNVAFLFSPPIAADRLQETFPRDLLEEVAKRSPLGQPAVFGLLLRADGHLELERGFDRYGFRRDVTDREVPPTQRRHLPDDKPANPAVGSVDRDRTATSTPPPGVR